MRPRFDSIEALRGLACLMVVWHHLWVWETWRGGHTPVFHEIRWCGFLSVDVFFVISGFVLTYIHANDVGRPGAVRGFLARRFWRVFPTYWAALLLSAVALKVVLGAPLLRDGLADGWPHWVLLLPDGPGNVYGIPSWTLTYEMVFYAAFALLLVLPRRVGVGLLAVWAAVAAGTLAVWAGEGPGRRAALSPFVLEILGGCLIAALLVRGKVRWGRAAIAAGVAWAVAAAVLIRAAHPSADWAELMGRHGPRVLMCGPAALLIVYGAAAAEAAGRLRAPRWLARVGGASYSIYLTHFTVQAVCAQGGTRLPHGPGPHLLWLAGTVAACLGVGFLFHRAVEKPLWALARRKKPAAAAPPQPVPQRRAA